MEPDIRTCASKEEYHAGSWLKIKIERVKEKAGKDHRFGNGAQMIICSHQIALKRCAADRRDVKFCNLAL